MIKKIFIVAALLAGGFSHAGQPDCDRCYLTVLAGNEARPLQFMGPYSADHCMAQRAAQVQPMMEAHGFRLTCLSAGELDALKRKSFCAVVDVRGGVAMLSCDR